MTMKTKDKKESIESPRSSPFNYEGIYSQDLPQCPRLHCRAPQYSRD